VLSRSEPPGEMPHCRGRGQTRLRVGGPGPTHFGREAVGRSGGGVVERHGLQ